MRGLLLAALVEAGIITWRDLSSLNMLPLPSDYVAVAIFYGGLAFFPESASGFVNVLGWGIVIATAFNLWNPTNPTKLIYPGASTQVEATTLSGYTSNTSTGSAPYTGAMVTSTANGQPVQLGQGTSVAGGGTGALHG